MKLEQSFDVAAPLDRVWTALVDVEHVAPCLPGAAVTGRNEDGSYNGTLTVKIGPTTASYAGKLEMEQIDETAHTATMQAHGTDKRGQGGAKATIVSRLVPGDGEGTHVDVLTDLHITGRLARFGRGGMMEDISERMMKQFAERLQASLTGGGPAASSAGAASEAPAAAAADGDGGATAAGGGGGTAPAGGGGGAAPAGGGGGAATTAGGGAGAATTAGGGAGAATPEAAAAGGAASAQIAGPTSDQPPPHHHHHHHFEHAEPIEALSLGASVVLARVKRNPAPVAFVVGLLVALTFARRLWRARWQVAE
jgi:uncharacterized protein